MKKVILLVCIVVLSIVSFGCTKTIELTDEENYLIAEYAAEILLKYDSHARSKYYDGLEDTEYTDEDITTTEQQVDDQTVDVYENDTGESDTKQGEAVAVEPEGSTEVTDDESESVLASDFDIASFIEGDEISVQYESYTLADNYPSYDRDGVYVDIEAPSGYKLLILKFAIENKTNELQYLDMYGSDLEYTIILNDSKSAKQMLTILMDDLYTYQSYVDAGAREEAVLLFQVADSVADSIDDIKLKVSDGDSSKVIQLQ